MVPASLDISGSQVVPSLAKVVGHRFTLPVAEEEAGQIKREKSVVLLAFLPYQRFYLLHPTPEHL